MGRVKANKDVTTLVKRFSNDKKGMAAQTFAIAALPLITLLGLTFDASMAYRYKGDLQAAADATTLTLARRSVLHPDLSEAELVADGKRMFEAKLAAQNVPGPINYDAFTVDTGRVDAVIKANVNYNLSFGAIVGMPNLDVGVESRAEFERNELDFYVLVDNSPSMATGADLQAISDLEDEFNCAFACHVTSSDSYIYKIMGADTNGDGTLSASEQAAADATLDNNNNGQVTKQEKDKYLRDNGIPTTHHTDTYDRAKQLGIPLRIDAVARGIQALTDRIIDVRAFEDQHRVGLYHFGLNSWDTNPVKPVAVLDPTHDMNAVRSKANEIELMIFGSNNYANTNFADSFDFIGAEIEADMDDPANEDKRPILFVVSDGVNNSRVSGGCPGRGNSNRCMEPVRAEYCTALKDKGVRIAVLYTPYLPLPSNGFWRSNIQPQMDDIPRAMEACATPGLYFEADMHSTAIEDAMVTLLERAIRALRLTGV